jgi:hypothetical protein
MLEQDKKLKQGQKPSSLTRSSQLEEKHTEELQGKGSDEQGHWEVKDTRADSRDIKVEAVM